MYLSKELKEIKEGLPWLSETKVLCLQEIIGRMEVQLEYAKNEEVRNTIKLHLHYLLNCQNS